MIENKIERVVKLCSDELIRARAMHRDMNSAHEAYAVILEELDEFWEEVRMKKENRSKERMRTELIQTAAMCLRAVIDLRLEDKP